MKPIRVLHVTSETVSNNFLNTLADATDPAEVDYSFLTFGPTGGFVEALSSRGRRTIALNTTARLPLAALSRILKQENPDIVNTHLFHPTLATVMVAKRPVVLTRHHSDAHHRLPAMKRAFYLRLEHYINSKVEHIIAPAQMVRDVLVDWEGVPADKVTVIPYGQSTARFEGITPAELPMKRGLALVCVSRLFHRKGHQYLFEAFAQLTREGLDATLYLVGTGDYRPQLEALAAQLGIADRVQFLGWRSDALQIIAAADVLVHPSLEDALSQALIEALMLGVPIVATDISGASDTLGGGQYGKLVPPADANAFRDALRDTIANLPAARENAAQGRAYLLDYMSAERVAAAYAQVYRAIMNTDA